MAQEQMEQKLAAFEEAIMQKAGALREEILHEAEEKRRNEMEAEQTRLLTAMAEQLQRRISDVQAENRKEISREMQAFKRELYREREEYLAQLIEKVRAELLNFAQGSEYESWFTARADALTREYDCAGGRLLVREQDLRYTTRLRILCPGCEIVADDSRVTIGGLIFQSPAGYEADWSLDAALSSQREWFCQHSGLNFD